MADFVQTVVDRYARRRVVLRVVERRPMRKDFRKLPPIDAKPGGKLGVIKEGAPANDHHALMDNPLLDFGKELKGHGERNPF